MNVSCPSSVIAIFFASVVSAGCVATDPDSLGELESSGGSVTESVGEGSEGGATGGSDGGATSIAEGGSEGSSDDGSEGGSTADTGVSEACPDPMLDYYEPASCPSETVPLLPGAGCYQACDGPEAPCDVGVCTQVDTNPCLCDEGPAGGDCCAACSAWTWVCTDEVADEACAEVIGTTFWSIDLLECGLGPVGVEMCHWSIHFEEDGTFSWMYSDVGDMGTYACVGGVLSITSGPMVDVSYDPGTDVLTWDGVDYLPAL